MLDWKYITPHCVVNGFKKIIIGLGIIIRTISGVVGGGAETTAHPKSYPVGKFS